MIAYRADNWLIFQADKRNDNRVTLPPAKKIITFVKIPAFKDSSFWRFPLLEIPRFKKQKRGKNVYFTFPVYHKRVACHSFEYVFENRCLFRIIKSNIRMKITYEWIQTNLNVMCSNAGFLSLFFCYNMIRSYLTEKNSTYLISKAWWSPSPSLSLFWWITFVLDARYCSIGRHTTSLQLPRESESFDSSSLWTYVSLPKHDIYNSFFPQQRRVSFQ